MKNIALILVLLFSIVQLNAQVNERKTRKEKKAEREAIQKEKINNLLHNKTFVFTATHALPMSGGSRYLNYDYDVVVNKDSVNSYLPFFGVAYRVEYGARNSAFEFYLPLEEYELKKEKDGYVVDFEVDKDMDHLNYTFRVSELGNATLHVSSTNRQSITYYGEITEIQEE